MPILSKSYLKKLPSVAYKSSYDAEILLKRSSNNFRYQESYDVFLSHRKLDAREVLALKELIESQGLSVYVDWLENPELDRSNVTPATADHLRAVMDKCRSLLYAISMNSSESKWMPWELGYSDARHGNVAIVPLSEGDLVSAGYQGQEFLGLYPYISADSLVATRPHLMVNRRGGQPTSLKSWI
jgi:hypothetical protein